MPALPRKCKEAHQVRHREGRERRKTVKTGGRLGRTTCVMIGFLPLLTEVCSHGKVLEENYQDLSHVSVGSLQLPWWEQILSV